MKINGKSCKLQSCHVSKIILTFVWWTFNREWFHVFYLTQSYSSSSPCMKRLSPPLWSVMLYSHKDSNVLEVSEGRIILLCQIHPRVRPFFPVVVFTTVTSLSRSGVPLVIQSPIKEPHGAGCRIASRNILEQ